MEDDKKNLVKCWYVDQFRALQKITDFTELEIVHADVNQIHKLFIRCKGLYTKGKLDMGNQLGS